MNLIEYQAQAMRTAKIMEPLAMLIHGAMGCMTEAGEFSLTLAAFIESGETDLDKDNVCEELGDCAWFAAYMSHAVGTDMAAIMALAGATYTGTPVTMALRLNAAAADIGTLIKAHAYYGKSLDHDQLKLKLNQYFAFVGMLSHAFGLEFPGVLQENVEKLQKRYPDKYSDTAAIERADKVEMQDTLVREP